MGNRRSVRRRHRFPTWSLILLLVPVLAILFWVGKSYQFPHSDEESAALAKATSPASRAEGKIEITAWVSREVIRSGDSFEIWILVKNLASQDLTGLKLVGFESPGFVPAGNCWVGMVPGCRPGSAPSSQPSGLEGTLKPGASSIVFAELKSSRLKLRSPRPQSSGGTQVPMIVAKVAGTFAGREQRVEISLRPADVTEHAPSWAAASYSLLKDFLLPVMLGILAFTFQHVLQERSREQSTRNALLATATTNAVQYLLPISTAIEGLRRHAQDPSGRGFFYFVFVMKRMRDLAYGGGGFFFEDTRGEELPNECWSIVLRRLGKRFGHLDLSHSMDLMEKRETISKFLCQLEPPKGVPTAAQLAAQRVKDCFLVWSHCDDSAIDLGIFGIMSEAIQFEANRLYLGWYKEVPAPNQRTLENWERSIETLAAVEPALAQELFQKLYSYVGTLPWRVRWQFKRQLQMKRAPQPAAPVSNP